MSTQRSQPPEPEPERGVGMVDPRTMHPGPDDVLPLGSPAAAAPEPTGDEPATDSTDPDGSALGLVDPRSEVPGPSEP